MTIASIVTAALLSTGTAVADSFDDQINALRVQAAQQQQQASDLHAQADDYRAEVQRLQGQISSLNTQIQINTLKSQKTAAKIEDAKSRMVVQKTILNENVKQMYLMSSTTPLEMLASSDNLSEFFDQQAYQDKIKDKVFATIHEVQTLKDSLENDQKTLQAILSDLKGTQAQAAQQQQQMNSLLALAAQNAAAADQQVKNSNSQIASLRAQQAAALAAKYGNNGLVVSGTCGGGYPDKWCGAAQDTVIDNWGMYNRECVSYTAFKVAVSGRHMPYWGGRGNANQWPSSARADGIPVDNKPHVGDVAISTLGPYGHAMYVEGVSGGNIIVSQYNYSNRGEYSTMTIPAAGLYFIHF
ncbi:MAG TPA: CHAP domain-containing protein [Candidatus Saccharimonadia bacterium]